MQVLMHIKFEHGAQFEVSANHTAQSTSLEILA